MMTSVEAVDDVEEMVDGWLKGKSREKLVDIDGEALAHASTVGLGYTGKTEPTEKPYVLTRQDEILREKVVSSRRKERGANKAQKKRSRADDDDDDDERYVVKADADKDLEVSRTAIRSKKTKADTSITATVSNSSVREEGVLPESNSSDAVPTSSTLNEKDSNDDQITSRRATVESRPICINYSEYGQCRFGDGCRYSHACEPGIKKTVSGYVRQRTRKKTRSKQKNIRKDTRPTEVKPQNGR